MECEADRGTRSLTRTVRGFDVVSGHLGKLALADGSFAIDFANITCYSVLSGLVMGMEPICGQAFGAK
ncbi:Multi antimicrobial extrusion protein [Corchorus capsularis]|uniref:Multi antimicrobial extrusion protein n=1 Tax=Corchorus capsularis TaxID=210143 RepID=A0A1R3J4I6_COCAP|nr:Multi antimicrobial extrusion protein [Corchorus capsularis]